MHIVQVNYWDNLSDTASDFYMSNSHSIQEHFHLATFHTCHGSAEIDEAGDRPADGVNATLVDANCY